MGWGVVVRWCSQEFSLGVSKEVVGFQILKQTNELWTGQNCGMGGKEEGCGKFVFFPPIVPVLIRSVSILNFGAGGGDSCFSAIDLIFHAYLRHFKGGQAQSGRG